MSASNQPEFRYFRSVEGKVVPRYGSMNTFIGVRRGPGGWVWNTDDVFAIPVHDVERKYLREYRRAIKDGSLVEVTKAEYDAVNQPPPEPEPDPEPDSEPDPKPKATKPTAKKKKKASAAKAKKE